jgi:hypothetical protein
MTNRADFFVFSLLYTNFHSLNTLFNIPVLLMITILIVVSGLMSGSVCNDQIQTILERRCNSVNTCGLVVGIDMNCNAEKASC